MSFSSSGIEWPFNAPVMNMFTSLWMGTGFSIPIDPIHITLSYELYVHLEATTLDEERTIIVNVAQYRAKMPWMELMTAATRKVRM